MRVRWMAPKSVFRALVVAGGVVSQAWAGTVAPDAVPNLLKTLQAPAATEPPVVYQDENGYVKFLGAPAGGEFIPGGVGKASGPAATAQSFVESHRGAFGITTGSALSERKSLERKGNSYIRFGQSVAGVPVYGADVVVQVNAAGNIVNVANDAARDLGALESGAVSLTPSVGAAAATESARRYVDGLYGKVSLAQLSAAGAPKLYLFQPSVLGQSGPLRLVWQVEVTASQPEQVRQEVFIDAANGESVFHFSKLHDDCVRRVFDVDGGSTVPTLPAREEGDEPSGILEVDSTYDYLGDMYGFFDGHFGRDSYDDLGATLIANVNYNFANAFWDGEFLLIGKGFGTDDIVGHEMSHAVTEYTSNLIYQGFSGALNEAMSDVFGELMDLENGKGDDRPEARWWLGEDLYDPTNLVELPVTQFLQTSIRYMKDPTVLGQPDRLFSPLLVSPLSFFDNGGVHINSGIINKLAYLLTDGDTFNGKTVYGLGADRVADLYYGAELLLPASADFYDFYFVLGQVASNLGMTLEDRLNIKTAAQAVEIEPLALNTSDASIRHFRAVPTRRENGAPVVSLSWENPESSILSQVTLVRNIAHFPTGPTDGVVLSTGKVEKFLDDQELQEGVTYYYALIAELTTGFPQLAYAKAVAGSNAIVPAIEPFGRGTGAFGTLSTIDLAYSQLTFTPVGNAKGNPGTNEVGVSYEGYDVTFRPGVFELPVARDNEQGGAITLPLADDQLVSFGLGLRTIPFFGKWYGSISVSSNGYIAFDGADDVIPDTSPTIADALDAPRIDFLFTDLNPAAGGEVWAKQTKQSVVFTFTNVPEYRLDTLPRPNTVQVEIFDTGTIQVTYGEVSQDPNFPMSTVVGLSDGNGAFLNPATLFPDEDLVGVDSRVDLSSYPAANRQLSLAPQGAVTGEAGEHFQFTARAVPPAGAGGVPVLFAEWTGNGAVPFADNGNGTGTFDWQSSPSASGVYIVRVRASLNGQQAYQDIRVILDDTILYPSATQLGISTGMPFEDPLVSRYVGDDRPLTASYVYINPLPGDPNYEEGNSIVFWIRNGQTVPTLYNARQVPAGATQPGDQWYFRVVPVTASFIAGTPVASPVVTVAGYPVISQVTPNFGNIHGGDKVRISGTLLRGVLQVTFGGIEAAGIRSISDTEIEVITPVHLPGVVPIAVRTTNGTGTLQNAFTFLGDGGDFPHSDVNGDGQCDATDVQLVINAVLAVPGVKGAVNADINRDGGVNAGDIQAVVNSALYR